MLSRPKVLPLYEGTAPNSKASSLVEKQIGGESLRIENVQIPSIEVFLPPGPRKHSKAALICPGGGYSRLTYEKEGTRIAAWLSENDIAGIVLKYRLPNDQSSVEKRLTPMLDAERALRLIRLHADEWNIDPNSIGVMGFSAGGHLASTLGTRFDQGDATPSDPVGQLSSRPDFMILLYPVISMLEDSTTHRRSRSNLIGDPPAAGLMEHYSNQLQASVDTPPSFIVHAADDKAVPVANSLLFYEALLSHGVDAELHVYPYGGHGFALAVGMGRLQGWSELCLKWIEELGPNRRD